MTEQSVLVVSFEGDDVRFERCLAVRRTVFIDEQGVSEEEEVDGLDERCRHFLASTNDRDLGAARMRMVSPSVAKAERVAVHRSERGRGVGRQLMCALEAAAWAQGAHTVKLGAQLSAVPFYIRLGYRAYGPEFDDAGIPHRMMEKRQAT